ncbi:MAG: oxidoreductase [Micrococcales bacterium]|nr:oxidoreductase [Micrococcales bacterium]
MSIWNTADIPDQSGKVVIVTGASSGIGLITARELARAGAYVVMACRNLEKANAARQTVPGGDNHSEVRHLDLADLDSVRAFAESISDWRIDTLVNNAGLMATPDARTVQGHEMQFGVNVLGHFLLTTLLLPQITDRVVWVSSLVHTMPGLDLTDLDWTRRRYSRWRAYSASKLADLMLSYQLQRRLVQSGSRVRSMAAHPGVASTALQTRTESLYDVLGRLVPLFGNTPEVGALSVLYAATVADLPGGTYIGPNGNGGRRGYPRPVGSSAASHDTAISAELWRRCEQLTALPG